MKDAETKADQILEEEAKRHREAYSRIERDRNLEIDLLCNRCIFNRNILFTITFFHLISQFSVECLDKNLNVYTDCSS